MSAVRESIRIRAPRERVFEAYVSEIDRWWPRQGTYRYTFAGSGESSGRLSFEGREGGRFYEQFEDGSQFVIGHITVWDPPQRLVYTWQAPDWPSHTVVEVRLEEAGGETEVTVTQSGFGEKGVPDWSANYATGLQEILASFGGWVVQASTNRRKTAMETPEEVWQKLEAVRAGTLQRLAGFSQEQLDRRPPAEDGEEAWSLGEIFMHLAIDEIYLREMIARPLLEGVKPPDGVRFLPPPPPYGTKKDVIQYWFERARLATRRLFEAWPERPDIALQHEGGLRPMNGLQWLYAYTGHEELHQRQIDEMGGNSHK